MKFFADSKLLAAALTCSALVALTAPAFGQGFARPDGSVPLPQDWSNSHIIFTKAFKSDHAPTMYNDPRVYASWMLHGHHAKTARKNSPQVSSHASELSEQALVAAGFTNAHGKNPAPPAKKVDWSFTLGSFGVAKNMSPAKYQFDVTATPSCTNDFVVYGLNGTGTGGGQPDLVALNNLYTGSGVEFCTGTGPAAYWAYKATPNGGKVSTSPVISLDGTKVAFIESTTTGTWLHVVKWKANNGTITASVTPTAATNITSCTAPCMSSLQLDSANGDTNSSLFYDYSGSDSLWVGNNAGRIFRVNNIFGGTLALATTNGFGSCGTGATAGCISVGATTVLTSPVVDINTGNLFVGAANGSLYEITSAGHVSSAVVGTSTPGIVDSPIVDGSNGDVYAFTGSNGTNPVVVEFDETLTVESTATLGTASTTINLHDFAFDNNYFNWDGGTDGNDGHLIVCGNPGGQPTLYMIPFSQLKTATVTTAGSGYTSVPTVNLTTPGSGTGGSATLTVAGPVASVNLTAPGSGYPPNPTVTISGTGSSATASATINGSITGIAVGGGGTGYSSPTTVTITPATGGAAATATLGFAVASFTSLSGGSGYTTAPSVTLSGGGATTQGTANSTISGGLVTGTTGVTFSNSGSGYTSVASASAFSGGGTGAAGTVSMGVGAVTMPGSVGCFTAAPTLTFSGGGGTGAAGTPVMGAANASGCTSGRLPFLSVTITTAGSGYTTTPTMATSVQTCHTGTCPATYATTLSVVSLNVTTAGTGYTGASTVTFSGGGGSGAAATVKLNGAVTGLSLVTGGVGYTSVPTVAIGAPGTGTTATATAVLATTGAVKSVTVSNAGSGYTAAPTIGFTSASGSGASATATVAGPIATLTLGAPGSGYSPSPTVSISGGAGATATATINGSVTGVSLVTTGSSGYNQSFNATLTGGGGTGAVVAVTAAAGDIIPSGTPSATALVTSAVSGDECSPITEIFNTIANTDLIFWGSGSSSDGQVSSLDITLGVITGTQNFVAEPNAVGGTSAIIVDNIAYATTAAWVKSTAYALGTLISDGTTHCGGGPCAQSVTTAGTSGTTTPSWSATVGNVTNDGSTLKWTNLGENFGQASSVYFGNLGNTSNSQAFTEIEIASTSGSGNVELGVSGTTTWTTAGYAVGQSVAVSGLTGTFAGVNGTWVVTGFSTNSGFQNMSITVTGLSTTTGFTAVSGTAAISNGFSAIKLTQSGLQ